MFVQYMTCAFRALHVSLDNKLYGSDRNFCLSWLEENNISVLKWLEENTIPVY